MLDVIAQSSHAPRHDPSPGNFRPGIFAVTAACLYALAFYPHGEGTLLHALLSRHLRALAGTVACLLRGLGDAGAGSAGTHVLGAFPMEIALDCAALELMALHVAGCFALRGARGRRLAAALLGCLTIALVNVARILALYAIGRGHPELFSAAHEGLLAAAMLAFVWLAHQGTRVWLR